MCQQFSCETSQSCKVPAEVWETILPILEVEKTWELVADLEQQWLASPVDDVFAPASQTANYRYQWLQITDYYWRKETETPVGKIVAEIVTVDNAPGYHARVRVAQTDDPQRKDQAISRLGASSLSEAQADCEVMIPELITYSSTGIDFSMGFSWGSDHSTIEE